MRLLVLLACLLPGAALADLYRWIDPESGSVRYSNFPPPPGVKPGSVEVVPYKPAPEPEKVEKAAAKPPAPKPAPAGAAPPSAPPPPPPMSAQKKLPEKK